MTRLEARYILDAAAAGTNIPEARITEALIASGDLDPQQVSASGNDLTAGREVVA